MGNGSSPHTARHCRSFRKESSIIEVLIPGHVGLKTTGPYPIIKYHALTNCSTEYFIVSHGPCFRHLRFNPPSLYQKLSILGQEPPRNRVYVKISFPKRKLIPLPCHKPSNRHPDQIRICQVFVFNYKIITQNLTSCKAGFCVL